MDEFDGLARDRAEDVWNRLLGTISKALVEKRAVSLIHVGTLKPYTKIASRYRMPGKRAIRVIPPRSHIKFVLAPALKAAIRDE